MLVGASSVGERVVRFTHPTSQKPIATEDTEVREEIVAERTQ
jgi:hypothetical protein